MEYLFICLDYFDFFHQHFIAFFIQLFIQLQVATYFVRFIPPTSFLWGSYKWWCIQFQISVVHFWYIGKQLTFVHELCILQLCCNLLLVPVFCLFVCQFFWVLYIDTLSSKREVVVFKERGDCLQSFISSFPTYMSPPTFLSYYSTLLLVLS